MRSYLAALLVLCLSSALPAEETLKLLFLGDNGHHQPARRFDDLEPVLKKRGIELQYTDNLQVLNAKTLAEFDGLVLYANIDNIEPEQAKALLDYVAGGKGFIPLHCATYCFRNSPEIVALMGGQFKRHGAGVFTVEPAEVEHPILKDYGGFVSWDESYIHTLHNDKDRTVLEYRSEGPQEEGKQREPWTWVRTHGKGRVFYTAWGHDERTWKHPGFVNLVERGIRWACGDDPAKAGPYADPDRFPIPQMTSLPTNPKPFEYVDVGPKIPNYTPGERWGTQAEPKNLMQKPLPAAESMQHFVTPVGFEVRLFASEPQLGGKPIAMNWDERGRLWVCETYDYPNELQPDGQGRDRIRICEDSDGDGKADKFTVFAEKLSIPTAIVCYRGGVVVQNGGETLYLKDTDGDDKADVRKTLITGWAINDTHGGVSNFRYGLDNWVWGMQGYNNSTPTIDGEEQQSFRQGFFRFKLTNTDPPTVENIEFLRSTDNNTWGLGISEEGLVFGSTANHNPSVYLPIPNRYYEQVRGWGPQQLGTIADTYLFKPITDKIRQVDHHGGYTAGAGHALYTARNYPQSWWNKTAFVCGPTGHLVGTFVLRRSGSDYTSTSPVNLLASDDEWSAPILAEVGPDGNVWVVDWYNFIVQHNPTPAGFENGKGNAYESELRDKKHGRIYRVVHTAGKQSTSPQLDPADPDTLVQGLTDPTMRNRLQAQRLLVERGELSVVPALIALTEDRKVDVVGLNVGAIHALQTLHGLGALSDASGPTFAAAVKALTHPSAGVRRNALAVLPGDPAAVQAILDKNLVGDTDAQVRLAALLALADMPASNQVGVKLAELTSSATLDRWLSDGLTSAAATHASGFLRALAQPTTEVKKQPVNPKALATARIVAEHLSRGKLSGEELERLLANLATAEPPLVEAVLSGLSAGWPRNYEAKLGPAGEESLVKLLELAPADSKAQLLRLGSLWGSTVLEKHVQTVVQSLLTTIQDTEAEPARRVSAAGQLVEFRPEDGEIVEQLLGAISPQTPPEVSQGFIESLLKSRVADLGEKLVERISAATPAMRAAGVKVLLSRPQTTRDLLAAVEAGDLQLTDLTLEQRQALSSHPDEKIRQAASKMLAAGGGLPNPDRQKILQEKLPLTQLTGDVALGKAVFKKHCAKCHKHSGEGEKIGPDLTGMAVHPKRELLTHILDPSASVEGNFRMYSVVTVDGLLFNGMLASETRTTIEIIDAEAKRHTIQRSDIEELISTRKSLMPEGFEKLASDEELKNLLEFLSDKGPYLPIPLDKVATVVTTQGMFYERDGDLERLIFPDWKPKVFEGVPFLLVDPQDNRVPNAIMLHGPLGNLPPQMPKSVTLPCNTAAKAIHLLSGVSGWGAQGPGKRGLTMIVRLKYADGTSEDHELYDGVHFADYIGDFNVPESRLAYRLRGQQIRYLAVTPKRPDTIQTIELVKGSDRTAPVVMAVTVETLK